MSTRDFLVAPGGATSLKGPIDFVGPGSNGESQGVFANYPSATVKYGQKGWNAEGKEDVARLYIQVDAAQAKDLQTQINQKNKGLENILPSLFFTGEGSASLGYVDFMLEGIDFSQTEKVQIQEVLSDNYVVYFYGRKPSIFQLSGKLFNTLQDNQSIWFDMLYNAVLRGSALAELRQVVHLRFDGRIASGVLLNLQQSERADTQMCTSFSAQLLVKDYDVLTDPLRRSTFVSSGPTSPSGLFVNEVAIIGETNGAQSTNQTSVTPTNGTL